ncbi:hypothetical protein ERJ75_001041100 [Trypanosoma vivax]|nr:hypothetical protein TRVL_10363 [Trypanosoma vivax]KAH8610834.1 hypothetical protein ERJ75_001041100 [Trypanosoma vivax]
MIVVKVVVAVILAIVFCIIIFRQMSRRRQDAQNTEPQEQNNIHMQHAPPLQAYPLAYAGPPVNAVPPAYGSQPPVHMGTDTYGMPPQGQRYSPPVYHTPGVNVNYAAPVDSCPPLPQVVQQPGPTEQQPQEKKDENAYYGEAQYIQRTDDANQ